EGADLVGDELLRPAAPGRARAGAEAIDRPGIVAAAAELLGLAEEGGEPLVALDLLGERGRRRGRRRGRGPARRLGSGPLHPRAAAEVPERAATDPRAHVALEHRDPAAAAEVMDDEAGADDLDLGRAGADVERAIGAGLDVEEELAGDHRDRVVRPFDGRVGDRAEEDAVAL